MSYIAMDKKYRIDGKIKVWLMRRILYGINSVLFLNYCPSQGCTIEFLLLISFQPVINGHIALCRYLSVMDCICVQKQSTPSKNNFLSTE